MKKRIYPYIFAVIFLLIAVITGRIASEAAGKTNVATEAVSSTTGEIGRILADLLWLQLDQYHHIWMYQGNNWVTATDYLPQLWLLLKLDPKFADAYIDGGYHLVINLGESEEGFRLLSDGIRQCPDNERVFWERLTVIWDSEYYEPRATQTAAWDYLNLIKRKRGVIEEPWNEANAAMILEFSFESDSLRRNHQQISDRYAERCDFIRFARRHNLWTPAEY